MADDPRTDKQGGHIPDPPSNSNPREAPGGLGSGAPQDPANEPAAQPGKQAPVMPKR